MAGKLRLTTWLRNYIITKISVPPRWGWGSLFYRIPRASAPGLTHTAPPALEPQPDQQPFRPTLPSKSTSTQINFLPNQNDPLLKAATNNKAALPDRRSHPAPPRSLSL